jgi:flagellar basal body rod protein FlgG
MSKAAKIEEQNTADQAKVQQMEQMEAGLPKVKENIQRMVKKQKTIIGMYPSAMTTEKAIESLQAYEDNSSDFHITDITFTMNQPLAVDVQTDGSAAYTRNGQFTLNDEGTIVTPGNGYPLQPEIQIPENAQSVTVGEDGQVSVQLKGDGQSQVVGQINTTDFVNPTGLQPMGENLFLETQSSGAPIQGTAGADGLGVIKQGMLETSNVNVTEELVNLIQAQRVYEMNSKVISAVDSMMSFLTQRT